MCICLTDRNDVDRVSNALRGRLARFGLKLNEEKTAVITLDRKAPLKGQLTLKFLGFEFFIGKTQGGKRAIQVRTQGKSLRGSLKDLNNWIKRNRNQQRLRVLWSIYCSKIRGHLQCFGVSGNSQSLNKYCHEAKKIFFKWVNRRSQKRSFNWEKFHLFLKVAGMPKPRIVYSLY